jgi:Mg-chelatase subunit ChlD
MDTPSVEIIVDASGSMGTGRNSLMQQAKSVLTDLIDNDLPDGIQVALRVFGSKNRNEGTKQYGSGFTTLVQPLTTLDRGDLKAKIDGLTAGGNTPIAGSLIEAKTDLAGAKGSKIVVLVTDGSGLWPVS